MVDESFVAFSVSPRRLDVLWRRGWRHFGPQFARYSYRRWYHRVLPVRPLRIHLERCVLSRSHRRILRRNRDLDVAIRSPVIDEERRQLFEEHKARFATQVPDSLDNFLGPALEVYPCELMEVSARLDNRLVAASYLDVGWCSVYSVYGMFSLAEARRSLGIATMLWEMAYARERGARYYYLGYIFGAPSVLDYKKQFTGLQAYDWRQRWRPVTRRIGVGNQAWRGVA
ncbi:MAG: arginine-tRNA-protein transferase [Verrucomicrobia bacterium]|nr:arginine-tRNA-protein transferase [Verrucomicrobiota bacterium]